MSKIASSKFAWMAGAALALTAATVAYGAGQAPEPPAPPAAPAMVQQVVIVDKHGEDGGRDYVRTVTRDGKTYVFKTTESLSEAELEKRIASVEANMLPVAPVPPAADGKARVTKQRVIVVDRDGEQVTDVVTEEGDRCVGTEAISKVDTSSEADGKLTRVRVTMCGAPGEIAQQAKAQAVAGINKARAEIAQDGDLPEKARKEVLKELDAELARLKREG